MDRGYPWGSMEIPACDSTPGRTTLLLDTPHPRSTEVITTPGHPQAAVCRCWAAEAAVTSRKHPRGCEPLCTEGTAQTPPSSTCLSSGGKELGRCPGRCCHSVPQPAGQEPTCVQLCLVLVYHTQRVLVSPVAQRAPALSHPAWLAPAAIQHHLNSPSESEDKNSETTLCLVPS